MKYIFAFIYFLAINQSVNAQSQEELKLIETSRKSSVRIYSQLGQSTGTGFFINDNLIATCFHVIATYTNNNGNVNFKVFNDIKAITYNDDTISLRCISIPSQNDPTPLQYDFAILEVVIKQPKKTGIAKLGSSKNLVIGSNTVFSGFPLGTPTMVTHNGMVSGITKDSSLICIQSSINKGNSGGALLNKNGQVIGIISMREGGISFGLQKYLQDISNSEGSVKVEIGGVDPLQATKETINVIDTYISTGIGYAINIRYLIEYINRNKIKI